MSAWRRIGVVMAGGSGERFWPVSTSACPKQFLRLADPDRTLIEQAYERAVALGEPFVATSARLAEITRSTCGIDPGQILGEPQKRNTLGCLVWVAGSLMARYPGEDLSLAVLTADQRIEPLDAFVRSAETALEAAEREGAISVIGIKPTRPETGFGYVEATDPGLEVSRVARFREKPDLATATKFGRDPRFTWNSGMFFLTLTTLMGELERQQPVAHAAALKISEAFRRGDEAGAVAAFERVPSASFDKAVMEGAASVRVVRASFDWDDLGSWDSLRRSVPADPSGNVAVGAARFLDSGSNSVYVDGTGQEVALLGVTGMVVVVTAGHVLVVPEAMAQDVKRLLS